MKNVLAPQFRPRVERLEDREVPAFLAPITSAGGGINLATTDLNLDGRSDVAAIRSDNTVSVRLSNGDGTFRQSAILKGAQGDLYTLSASDRNGDGIPDIVASGTGRLHYVTPSGLLLGDYYTGTVYTTTWLGKGDGTFGNATMKTRSTQTLLGGWPPRYLYEPTTASADFNRDGVVDRATVWSTGIAMQLGNRDGSFQPAQTYDAGPSIGTIAVGDFNGDGWTDIVVVNYVGNNPSTLSVLFNDGNW